MQKTPPAEILIPNNKEYSYSLLCWFFFLIGTPALLSLIPAFQGTDLRSNFLYNLAVSVGNFSLVLLLFRDFLYRSLIPLPVIFIGAFSGFLASYGLNTLLSVLLSFVVSDLELVVENANQNAIQLLVETYSFPMSCMVVVMTPFVEEILFRGTIFGPLSKKNVLLAYVVSMVLFAGMHISSSIGAYPPLVLFLSFLEYLPVSFVLCYVYHKFRSIWVPIALHGAMNLFSVLLSL